MDANGIAVIVMGVIMGAIGAYKQYPKLRAKYGAPVEETEIQKPKPTIETLNTRLETLENELGEAREDRDEAIKERDGAREEIGKLRNEFQGKIEDLQKRLDSLELLSQEKDRNIARITSERDAIEKEHKALLIRYTERQDTVISMGNELNDLEIKVEALTIDNKSHKSLDVLVDEFGKRLVPALVTAFRDAIRSTDEVKVIPQESKP